LCVVEVTISLKNVDSPIHGYCVVTDEEIKYKRLKIIEFVAVHEISRNE